VKPVVEYRHQHRDGNVPEDAQLGEVPIRSVARHRALGEDLWDLGVDEFIEEGLHGEIHQIRPGKPCSEAFPCLRFPGTERSKIFRRTASGLIRDKDRVTHG